MAMTSSARTASGALPDGYSHLRLLVVEDSPADARLLQETVTDAGPNARLTLEFVRTLAEAEVAIRKTPYDCVLLDLGLPDATGHDNVQRLHAARRWQTIVIMTGLDSEEAALGNLQRGAQDYLVKGRTDGIELVRIIRRAIERNRVLSEVDRLREEQYHQATHDALTGLPNRPLFMERAHRVMSQAGRHGQQFVVGYLDLDGFKFVNDTHGHAVGDSLLRSIGRTLQGVMRDSDTVARVGGDEFLFLLSPINDEAQAERAMDRVRKGIALIGVVDGVSVKAAASIGLAHYPRDGEDMETLIVRADQAMYAAKRAAQATIDRESISR